MSTFVQCGAQSVFLNQSLVEITFDMENYDDTTVIILHPYSYVLSLFCVSVYKGLRTSLYAVPDGSARLGFKR